MRIISQDGTIDVNYDLGNLSIAKGAGNRENERSIYFHSCSSARGTKLATYSTAEKAQKAMEILRKTYAPVLEIQNLETEIEPDVDKNRWAWSIAPTLSTSKVEMCDNFYFQFPQDSEIEV